MRSATCLPAEALAKAGHLACPLVARRAEAGATGASEVPRDEQPEPVHATISEKWCGT